VAPISDLVATLNPTTAQGSGPSHHTVALSNRGNTPVRAPIVVSWSQLGIRPVARSR